MNPFIPYQKKRDIRVIAALTFCGVCIFALPFLVVKFLPEFGWFSTAANIYLKILLSCILITLCIFGIDKYLATIGHDRFPNALLYGCSFISAGIGSYWGRHRFRHKTLDHNKEGKNYASTFKIVEVFSLATHSILFIVIC